uniref:RRM domain-containing protein n=1 Tax=Setaria italica TaxID=4555 RepID=K3YZ05_SETIT
MGRKRKRPRKVEPPAERVHRESTGEEVDGEDSVTTNPPMAGPSVSVEREEVSEAAAAEEDEDIGELLEPFTRDELLELLTDACLRSPALLARVAASAASDAAPRRLFVHGLGPGATSAALAAAFAPFGAFDECHAVADRATGRCRGYGFVTFRRRCDARRALADSSKRVDGRSLFVDNVPERAAHDDLRGLFSKFGEIEEGPLGADRATGLFRGYAIFLYKTPEGLRKALEEPTKVFDGCELQCRRAYRGSNPKHAAATPTDTGVQSNGGAVTAVLSSVQAKDLALTSKPSLLQLNQSVGLKAKGSSSATAIALFRQNVPAGGAGILGAAPVTTAVSSSLVHGTSSTPP